MKFRIEWEEGDRVKRKNMPTTGRVTATDYFANDNDWVEVLWDGERQPDWIGIGFDLEPERPLPVPPKFASIEEADAWLAAHSG